ncbi:MAG TPA: crosslink repair DNA glycosylase YcaQ family protein [Actinomycetota bacterium]|nr:crosslink repair DNA glycosylase YcaQ family protein [Actinomycetota bacterium]
MRWLGAVQMDPTRAVERTEHLVLWSRLGRRYRPAELERLLWDERELFEYRAFILPTSDLPVHRISMRRYPSGDRARHVYVRRYLIENAPFRRYVLARLRREGPLRTRDLEDRAAIGWRTGGWNDHGRNTAMMLEILWAKGEVMIVGREGQQRIWDLAERRLPATDGARLTDREEARALLTTHLRAGGVMRPSAVGWRFEGTRPDSVERVLDEIVAEGTVERCRVEGTRAEWLADVGALERGFRPRTVLLSPFDRLVHDRRRAEELFGFRFRLEIYVPKARREHGYFAMPILHGDRLIGRIAPAFDRPTGVLRIDRVSAEPGAPASAGPHVARVIGDLGRWLGARDVRFGRTLPSVWRSALRA